MDQRHLFRGTLSGDGRPGPIEERIGRRLVRLVDPESREGMRLLEEGDVDLVGPDGEQLGRVSQALPGSEGAGVLGFEDYTQWSGASQNSDVHSEGQRSAHIGFHLLFSYEASINLLTRLPESFGVEEAVENRRVERKKLIKWIFRKCARLRALEFSLETMRLRAVNDQAQPFEDMKQRVTESSARQLAE